MCTIQKPWLIPQIPCSWNLITKSITLLFVIQGHSARGYISTHILEMDKYRITFYCDVTWAPLRPNAPASRLFVQRLVQANNKDTCPQYWPFARGIYRSPIIQGQQSMSKHHHIIHPDFSHQCLLSLSPGNNSVLVWVMMCLQSFMYSSTIPSQFL